MNLIFPKKRIKRGDFLAQLDAAELALANGEVPSMLRPITRNVREIEIPFFREGHGIGHSGPRDRTLNSEERSTSSDTFRLLQDRFLRACRYARSLTNKLENHATRANRRQRETAVNAYEQIPVGMALLDRDGRLQFANARLRGLLGSSLDESVTRPLAEFLHPDDCAGYHEALQRLQEGQLERDVRQVRLRHRSDGYQWCRLTRTFDRSVTDLTGSVVAVVDEIAEDHSKLTSLVASSEEWQATFDAIESPVLIFNTAGQLTKMNRAACAMTTDSALALHQMPFEMPGASALWSTARQVMDCVRTLRKPATLEARDEVTRQTWQIAGSLVRMSEDGSDRVILVISDMTRLVELQASASRNETMSLLGSLVSGVAHEVRNPLFGISSTLDAYEACSQRQDTDQRYLDVLRREVNRLNNLMKDLLSFGQPSHREMIEGSLSDAIGKAMSASSHLARRAGVEVVSTIRGEIDPVRLDPERLPQVFVNLIENSVQHSPAGSQVSIEIEQVQSQGQSSVVCVVRDRGRGFEGKDLLRVFEPFFTRRHGGTGLGLAIVRKIVEEHGGTITAANDSDGGALMEVRLPSARCEASQI